MNTALNLSAHPVPPLSAGATRSRLRPGRRNGRRRRRRASRPHCGLQPGARRRRLPRLKTGPRLPLQGHVFGFIPGNDDLALHGPALVDGGHVVLAVGTFASRNGPSAIALSTVLPSLSLMVTLTPASNSTLASACLMNSSASGKSDSSLRIAAAYCSLHAQRLRSRK